ncbi:MAG TPA: citrate/2-methylcitrate synthase, partial [Thermogutta sp.]|nr:citrate/2-methylcitrate synthase [Thermogutta sp.]
RAMGIPKNMFTVLFALGRLPGWIAHWREMHLTPNKRIHRPRQLYIGYPERPFVPLMKRSPKPLEEVSIKRPVGPFPGGEFEL